MQPLAPAMTYLKPSTTTRNVRDEEEVERISYESAYRSPSIFRMTSVHHDAQQDGRRRTCAGRQALRAGKQLLPAR